MNVQESKVQKHFSQAESLQIPDYWTALSNTTGWLGMGGDRRGAQNRGIFSFHQAVVPSLYRVRTNARKSLVHQEVNRPFVAVYYSYKDSGHASPLPPPSPPPKWKVELKNTETDQDSKHARTAWLHREEEKKPCQAPFQGLTTPLLRSFAQAADIQFSSSTADVRLSCTIGACSPGAPPGPTVWQ